MASENVTSMIIGKFNCFNSSFFFDNFEMDLNFAIIILQTLDNITILL